MEIAIPPETSWGLPKGGIWPKTVEKGKKKIQCGERKTLLTELGLFKKRINKENLQHKQDQSRSQIKAALKVLSKIIWEHQDKWLLQTVVRPGENSCIIPNLLLLAVHTSPCSILLWVLVMGISKPSTYFTEVYDVPILLSIKGQSSLNWWCSKKKIWV